MDLLNQLTDPNKKFVPMRIKSGLVDGRMKYESVEESDSSTSEDEEEKGVEYAKYFQEKEEAKYIESILNQDEHDNMSMPESNDDITSFSIKAEVDHMKEEEITRVFKKYTFNTHLQTDNLAIETHKMQILELIKSYSVVIIHGPTGCGKSTQVPQFILDDCRENNTYCSIAVTQPRRIAAISVARRVCEERGWSLGSVCGYQVSLEKQVSHDTILNYVTTGVLLQKLIGVKNLNEYTHIIVDEIHERDQEMDFLILLLRKFLYMNSFHIRIILMSATFDTEKFANYFHNNSRLDINIGAPTVFVTNKKKHSTQIFYADQLSSIGTIPSFNLEEAKIDHCLYKLLTILISAFDRLDGNDPNTNKKKIGNVLVFLPGIYEIEQAYISLRNTSSDQVSHKVDWFILPLHSSITNDEQKKVFCPPPSGKRKIILSTNIAESSITVPDIAYVVDFCLIKTLVLDPQTQYQSLKLRWASQDNCIQRAGRVGRVCDGRVYRLVTRSFYENQMDKSIIPEILRSPLERLVLATKMLEIHEPPKAILALALDPPNLSNIESTIWKLKECGGLLTTCQGIKMTSDGDLTFLGRVMASLPVDVHLSKLIVLGHMFSCLEECIIMAAGCSLSNLFSTPFQERLKAYTNKLMWADGSCSDLITFLNLYRVWSRNKRTNAFVNYRGEQDWARKNFLSVRNLKEWSLLINEMKIRLSKLGIVDTAGPGRVILSQSETSLFMKVVICGAFYPNYFKRSPECGQVDEREAVKEVGGRNPFNTVYLKGMDHTHPGPLYAGRIKELITDCGNNTQVSFENSKIFVQFLKNTQHEAITIDGQQFISTIPGKICMEVYRAVRRRQLKIETSLHVLPKDEGWRRAELLGIDRDSSRIKTKELYKSLAERSETSILPTSDVQYIKIRISSRIDPGHFWAHNDDEQTKYNLYYIEKELNTKQLQPANGNVDVGELYAGLYQTNNMFYRCRITSVNPIGKMGILTAHVLYIDYGNIGTITLDKLFFLPEEIKLKQPQAIECVLAGIQPSVVLNPRALWTDHVNGIFDKCTQDISLFAKIYSVVNGVVHLILYKKQPNSNDAVVLSFNEWLIEKEYAQSAEESYLSKINHEKRLQIVNNDSNYFHVSALSAEEDILQIHTNDVKPPSVSECRNVLHLKGPFSPLEMQIFSCTEIGITKQIAIEGNSVNSVLLDSNPEDPHERLIVAGSINQNATATSLILRHTSIMPNIPGFPMLMSLLFCPAMEPKPTADGSRFACILCGLGTNESSKKSLYPVHDMVVILDAELDQEDLNNVNVMRYWMNMAIEIMENVENNTSSDDFISCQQELKACLMKMLKKRRKPVPRTNVKDSSAWKKYMYEGEILLPGGSAHIVENGIWPLHWTMSLNNESEEIELKQNITDMQDMATKTIAMTEITCKFCNMTMYDIQEIRVHLVSQIHIDNMKIKNLQ